jgi:hypothetical protein
MRRRDFITLLGGATAWPPAARAQQPAMPVTGFLNAASPGPLRQQIAAFHEGLKESGYVEGQNVAGSAGRTAGKRLRPRRTRSLPALAADLVRRQDGGSSHSDALRQRGISVAFGAKPTWTEGVSRLIRSKMTPSRHRLDRNPAAQRPPDLILANPLCCHGHPG